MKNIITIMGGVALSLVLASATAAADYQQSMSKCLAKHANARDAATVMLECTAEGGKLSGCKVLTDSSGGKGFDRAALCVAEVLPMGSKTGVVKVPLRFPGGA
jgi:hypothetical protein